VPVGVPSASASASASPSGSGLGGAGGAGAGGGAPAAAGAGTASVVVVHVVGQVRHPGVRRLPVGSRVADAVAAAGGATRTADLGLLNLARVLVDGEQVRVPAPGDPVAVAPVLPGGGGGAGGPPGSPAGPVSLNTADLAALDTLPGVGPVLAQRILDWRTAHGRFASVDELGEVSGIGDKLLAQLSPLVTL
jgi:competence protein ComEA